MQDLPDILYVYKDFGRSDELRYSLRSLKNIPHRNVVISGDLPDWVQNVVHIPNKKHDWVIPDNRFLDAEGKFLTALESRELGEHYINFNDDFFVMQKIDKVPMFHMGKLAWRKPDSSYRMMLARTGNILSNIGIMQPLNYELHLPMPMEKTKRLAINYFMQRNMKRGQVVCMRSMYGNVYEVGGKKKDDVKNLTDKAEIVNNIFLSSANDTFQQPLGQYIQLEFPEKSPYEK